MTNPQRRAALATSEADWYAITKVFCNFCTSYARSACRNCGTLLCGRHTCNDTLCRKCRDDE